MSDSHKLKRERRNPVRWSVNKRFTYNQGSSKKARGTLSPNFFSEGTSFPH